MIIVSWYELLFSFQIFAHEWGVQSTSCHNTWQMYSQMHSYDAKQTCRSCASYLLQHIRLVDTNFKAVHNRPSNARFQCWAMGVSTRVSVQAERVLHEWLQATMGSKLIRKVTELQVLPVATTSTATEVPAAGYGLHRFWSSSR